eukprot:Protomagalhaensia_sp_Gyna_25__1185@NODE_1587_length_1710_cov_64_299820_g1293_i0_p1_GENE_NODE_1587_length_1710_cov_64_299820_g1293_i0NODE_1587_length_1710_cov_64_299820_g1293_i0_p1_ORF_typecomplete_len560_score98_90SesA/PF17107_5/4_4e03SesA/PF17107_5/1_4e04SesA/PF17107_5/0_34RPW8/PF05659_11/9_1e02RPW8/PF05659_11/4e03RPW8/PF05659_11/5_3e03RPW8/PF05659_11/1_1_NODE_1587_length_1710_cov_64_299820_g1293_i0351681
MYGLVLDFMRQPCHEKPSHKASNLAFAVALAVDPPRVWGGLQAAPYQVPSEDALKSQPAAPAEALFGQFYFKPQPHFHQQPVINQFQPSPGFLQQAFQQTSPAMSQWYPPNPMYQQTQPLQPTQPPQPDPRFQQTPWQLNRGLRTAGYKPYGGRDRLCQYKSRKCRELYEQLMNPNLDGKARRRIKMRLQAEQAREDLKRAVKKVSDAKENEFRDMVWTPLKQFLPIMEECILKRGTAIRAARHAEFMLDVIDATLGMAEANRLDPDGSAREAVYAALGKAIPEQAKAVFLMEQKRLNNGGMKVQEMLRRITCEKRESGATGTTASIGTGGLNATSTNPRVTQFFNQVKEVQKTAAMLEERVSERFPSTDGVAAIGLLLGGMQRKKKRSELKIPKWAEDLKTLREKTDQIETATRAILRGIYHAISNLASTERVKLGHESAFILQEILMTNLGVNIHKNGTAFKSEFETLVQGTSKLTPFIKKQVICSNEFERISQRLPALRALMEDAEDGFRDDKHHLFRSEDSAEDFDNHRGPKLRFADSNHSYSW